MPLPADIVRGALCKCLEIVIHACAAKPAVGPMWLRYVAGPAQMATPPTPFSMAVTLSCANLPKLSKPATEALADLVATSFWAASLSSTDHLLADGSVPPQSSSVERLWRALCPCTALFGHYAGFLDAYLTAALALTNANTASRGE